MSTLTKSPAPSAVERSLERGVANALARQKENGCFWYDAQSGPTLTVTTHLVLHKLGYALPEDTDKLLRQMATVYQLPDGAFADNPCETTGSLLATAAVWGTLVATGADPNDVTLRRARVWIDDRGGLEQIGKLELGEDPFCIGPFLAYAGVLDPEVLEARHLPLIQTLVPGLMDLGAKAFNVGLFLNEEWAAGLTSALIKKGPFQRWLERQELKRVAAFAEQFQNPNGSWADTTSQTTLAVAALSAMGLPRDAAVIAKGCQWLMTARRETATTLDYVSIGTDVWDTGLFVPALAQAKKAGLTFDSEKLSRAVGWLCSAQDNMPQPRLDRGARLAPTTGGWAFEEDNPRLPDCDDTGFVMAAIGRCLSANNLEASDRQFLDPELARRIQSQIDNARVWLVGMQHSDGGWASYMADQPRRPRAILWEHPLFDTSTLDWSNPEAVIQFFRVQLAEASDVSTEGVTGRVLHGLGLTGSGMQEPAVAHGVEFLLKQQNELGAWQGRWITNYLAGTAWCVRGLDAVGLSPNHPRVAKALDWMQTKQNEDGGWGETPASYTSIEHAGVGPSMPGLTGLVLLALLQCGRRGDCIERGIRYLLDNQAPDGTWADNAWTHVWLPPTYFYVMPSATQAYPLEALATYLALTNGEDVATERERQEMTRARLKLADTTTHVRTRQADGSWSRSALRSLRVVGDQLADQTVEALFAHKEQRQAARLFPALVHNDDPLPADLPAPLQAWFAQTSELPAWADPERIRRAQDFFVAHAGAIVTCLFCASLPQAYAAANGANVLLGTDGMTRHLRRRVLETAQFLFDVLPIGALQPTGKGIRAVQKVRLVHATVRTLMAQQSTWDEACGLPVNQEDLAGTMMTFSVVILDGLERMGLDVKSEQGEDWVHYWCVLGHLLGILPELMPRNRADADALMATIRDDQWATSIAGKTLAQDLVQMMGEYIAVPHGSRIAAAAMRILSGERCADILQLPRDSVDDMLLHAGFEVASRLGKLFPFHSHPTLVQRVSLYIMEALVSLQRGGKEAQFRIPDAVLHSWTA